MHRFSALVLFILSFSSGVSSAGIANKILDEAVVVGNGRLKYLVWEIYDATLYAPSGVWSRDKPFALTLKYLRSVKGNEIADRSIHEIRKQGYRNEIKLAAWHSQMKKIFPDVFRGTKLTGFFQPGMPTRFFKGTTEIGVIRDPEFGYWFFNIWLGRNTSEPDLRRQLMGRQ